MPTFKFTIAGVFYGADGPKSIAVGEFGGARAAGFYTTRVVDAADEVEAMTLAADSIEDELNETLGKNKGGYRLEFESCDVIERDLYDGPRRGFTFFSEE